MKLSKWLPEICILILALLVRLIQLNGSFWLDEAAQALESSRPLSQQLEIAADFQPPLFHLLVHGLVQVSRNEVWLRLASLIPGLATVWLTMLLGKRLFSRDVGLTAGILLATSQFHLFYSQELRPYSLAACLALAVFWFWLNLMDQKRWAAVGFIVFSLAGLYTMYLFPLFLLSLLILTFIVYRPRFARIARLYPLLVLGFLPWLPSFLEQVGIGTSLASASPVWSTIVSPPLLKMIPLVYLKFIFGRIPFDPTVIQILFAFLALVGVTVTFSRLRRGQSGLIVIGLTLLPVLFAFIISVFVPVLDPKRVLFCLPFLYLGIAAGLNKRPSSALILLLFLSLNLSAVRRYADDPDVQREPWREAVAKIESSASPDSPESSVIIFAFSGPFAPYVWYQTKDFPTLSITDPAQIPVFSNQSALLFDYLKPLYDPNDQIAASLLTQGFAESGFYQYPGIGKIRIYAR